MDNTILIVGGGPAGLGAALAFNNNNYKNILVIESRPDMNFDIRNSYPVGLNVRGYNSIKNLFGDSDHLPEKSQFGLRIDQWKIIVGPNINVANFDSGLVYGTSRTDVTLLLYEEVKRRGEHNIKILFGHKAKSVDLMSKTLTCETINGQEIQFKPKCLVVADGYRSRIRDMLAENDKSLKIQQWPWSLKFRVLCSDYNPITDLDQHTHYNQNRIYISKFQDGRWTAVIAIKEDSPEFLLSNEASDKNIDELETYLKKLAPQSTQLFTREDYKQFFTRTIFTGAVTKVSKLVVNNWAVLLGDAAHSAIPATGEGINSAVEDCSVLQSSLKKSDDLAKCLHDFEMNRLIDVNALSDIAYAASMRSFKNTFQIFFLSLFKRFTGPSKEDYLFGKESVDTKRYSEIVDLWKQQTGWLFGPNIPE